MILIENQYLAIGKPAEEQYSHYQTREEEPQIMDENSEIKNINYSIFKIHYIIPSYKFFSSNICIVFHYFYIFLSILFFYYLNFL